MLDFSHVVSNPGVDIQSFFGVSTNYATVANNQATEWQTWKKPRGVNWVYMIGVGGGANGITGTFTGTSVASAGGSGGGSGAQSTLLIPAMFVPNELFISTGSGGKVTSVISGGTGQAGGTTMITVEPIAGVTSGATNLFFLVASGGSASSGGTATAMSGNFPLAGRGWSQNFAGQNGGAAGATQNGAGGSITLPTTGLMVTGGAGSGGKDVTGTGGGAGGAITGVGLGGLFPTLAGGAAAASGTNAGNGINGYMVKPFMFYGGSGGGSGAFAATGNGSTGSTGGNGGPGCGGGASGPGYTTTGRPGDGGDGFVYIISW
jgi:hypothetical protein